jgi:UDP-3-O-[3-hydroxymyristoyl] glucosamine N-acyltransferase
MESSAFVGDETFIGDETLIEDETLIGDESLSFSLSPGKFAKEK